MKKLLFVIASILVLTSCEDVKVENSTERGEVVCHSHDGEDITAGPYANPFIIYGTDFGTMFQTMYKHGKFDDMIAFTSSESLKEHGKDVVLDFYKNELDFGYNIDILSNGTDGDTIILNYKADINATKKIVRINVVVENDTCKIVLPNKLSEFPS